MGEDCEKLVREQLVMSSLDRNRGVFEFLANIDLVHTGRVGCRKIASFREKSRFFDHFP